MYLYSLFSDERNCITEAIGNLREDLITDGGLLKMVYEVFHLKTNKHKLEDKFTLQSSRPYSYTLFHCKEARLAIILLSSDNNVYIHKIVPFLYTKKIHKEDSSC